MARINKTDVIQKAVNDLAISQSGEKIPNETLDKVQLVYSLNRQNSNFALSGARSTSGTGTLTMPTIDARSEIFLTSLDYNLVKDATCDVATGSLGVLATVDGLGTGSGISANMIQQSVITLTAQSEHVHIDFAYPIKLKPNTNITYTGSFTVGVMVRCVNVTGFITSSN